MSKTDPALTDPPPDELDAALAEAEAAAAQAAAADADPNQAEPEGHAFHGNEYTAGVQPSPEAAAPAMFDADSIVRDVRVPVGCVGFLTTDGTLMVVRLTPDDRPRALTVADDVVEKVEHFLGLLRANVYPNVAAKNRPLEQHVELAEAIASYHRSRRG